MKVRATRIGHVLGVNVVKMWANMWRHQRMNMGPPERSVSANSSYSEGKPDETVNVDERQCCRRRAGATGGKRA